MAVDSQTASESRLEPGQAALEAASHPAATDMMFFVAEGGRTHRFSRYYKEHLEAQRHGKAKNEK